MAVWMAIPYIASSIMAYLGAKNSADASTQAAATQVGASERAAELQYQAAQDALEFQKQQWYTAQQAAAPWIQAGQGSVNKLSYLLGVTPGSFTPSQPSTGTTLGQLGGLGAAGYGQTLYGGGETNALAHPYTASDIVGTAVPRSPTGSSGTAVPRTGTATPRAAGTDTAPTSPVMPRTGRAVPRATPASASSGTTGPVGASGRTGLVRMRAPDGTEQEVPAEYVEYYQSMGAEVV